MSITKADVAQIIVYDTVQIPDIQVFVDTAVTIVTSVIGDAVLPAGVFDIICKYFAAHLISITDPRINSEQVKQLSQSFQFKLSDGLGITHFGSTAMMLDTSGRLARWNRKVVEGSTKQIFWSGTATVNDVTS